MNHHPQVPELEFHVIQSKILPPSERLTNSVIVVIETKSVDILQNPTTGRQYRTERATSPRHLININLRGLCHHHIRSLLQNQLVTDDEQRVCDDLVSKISRAATNLGFGNNGFTLTIFLTITYQNFLVMPVVVPSSSSNIEGLLRMVLLGRMKPEELKSLKKETESCSICLENLSSLKPNVFLTRMTCSHVFHSKCLLEWLYRKNTCPLCRTVLYDQ